MQGTMCTKRIQLGLAAALAAGAIFAAAPSAGGGESDIKAQIASERKGSTKVFEEALAATEAKVWRSADGKTLPYRLHLPAKPEPGRLYPLVVHMHGAGSWGTNNLDQIRTGGADFISWAKRHGEEYVFIAPQTPKRRKWVDTPWEQTKSTMKDKPTPSLRMAMEIIDDAISRYPVDRDRVYLMGISMGGYAAWELLQRRPELFAAGLPCCGGGDVAQAPRLTDIAIWAFHGSKDKSVPVCRSRDMVAAIKAAGGKKILYREYKGFGHNVWTPTFSDDKVFEWLFSQRRTVGNRASPAVCAAAAAFAGNPPAKRMDRTKLLIGAYCLQTNARTDAHVKAIRDCGVDFIVGGIAATDRATLDLFAKHGVGAIVNGVVPGWWGGDGKRAGKMREVNPPEKYAAGAAAYKDHPAIWAVDIGDEPSALDFPYYGDVVRQLNKALPGMPLYLNLYPNYASVAQNNGKQTINQLGTPTYAEHVDVYCREVPLDYISYDFYPYLRSVKDTDRFLSKMYDNFLVVTDACRRTKRSFWYIPQVNSRFGLPPTSESRLRFQAYAALSFGAEAITWACWCKGWWTNNVIDAEGRQTEQYGKLRRVNMELKRIGPQYMRFRNVATHFVGMASNSPYRPSLPFSAGPDDAGYVHASNGAMLLVGEMVARDTVCGESAFFVTAADDPTGEHPATFEILFDGKGREVEAFGGQGKVPVSRKPDGLYALPFSSGQGLLLVLKKNVCD